MRINRVQLHGISLLFVPFHTICFDSIPGSVISLKLHVSLQKNESICIKNQFLSVKVLTAMNFELNALAVFQRNRIAKHTVFREKLSIPALLVHK